MWKRRIGPGTCRGRNFAILLVVLFLGGGCSHKINVPGPVEVDVAAPIQHQVPNYSEWIGTTVGYIDAQIHSKVAGYLLTQDYKEGSLVKTGDILFGVDPQPFQAVVDQANAQLNVARAELTQ